MVEQAAGPPGAVLQWVRPRAAGGFGPLFEGSVGPVQVVQLGIAGVPASTWERIALPELGYQYKA